MIKLTVPNGEISSAIEISENHEKTKNQSLSCMYNSEPGELNGSIEVNAETNTSVVIFFSAEILLKRKTLF